MARQWLLLAALLLTLAITPEFGQGAPQTKKNFPDERAPSDGELRRSEMLWFGVPAYRITRAVIEDGHIELRDQITRYEEHDHVLQSGEVHAVPSQIGQLRVRRLPTDVIVFYDAVGNEVDIKTARRRLKRESTVVALAGGIPQKEYLGILNSDALIVSIRAPEAVPLDTREEAPGPAF